jgi:hypothetical protein
MEGVRVIRYLVSIILLGVAFSSPVYAKILSDTSFEMDARDYLQAMDVKFKEGASMPLPRLMIFDHAGVLVFKTFEQSDISGISGKMEKLAQSPSPALIDFEELAPLVPAEREAGSYVVLVFSLVGMDAGLSEMAIREFYSEDSPGVILLSVSLRPVF